MWWSHDASEELSFGPAQEILSGLRQNIGKERTQWDNSFNSIKAKIKQQQHILDHLLRDPTSALSPDKLTQAHKESLYLVDEAHRLVSESRRCLEVISETRQQAATELAAAREQKKHVWPWAMGDLRKEIKMLTGLEERVLAPDQTRLTMERDRLITEIWMLNKQITLLQNYIRSNCGKQGAIWYQTVVSKINVHKQNWQNARSGLPTNPIPKTAQLARERRMTGVVKWYDASRREGIISSLDGGEDIIVNRDSLNGIPYLQKGQRVGFTLKHNQKGAWAANVIRLR